MFNTVFIVPTGIGCSIGGHAGDATPEFKLVASISDIAICNPNVVNASDINEMPDNTWYVEGSMLDRFLEGNICLKKPKSNKILLVVNKPIKPETLNAVSAAKYSIGCNIQVVQLDTEFRMVAFKDDNGCASGQVSGCEQLIEQVSEYDYDALAIATGIECPKTIALDYLKNGGINPWGGVEAIASKRVANAINKPVAHAPVETDEPDIKYMNEVSPPRNAAEMLSMAFIHCVFKGLWKAPRIAVGPGLCVDDIDCLITPLNCYGPPHRACTKAGIPVIGVRENRTCLNCTADSDFPDNYTIVENYHEAVGVLQAMKIGINYGR